MSEGEPSPGKKKAKQEWKDERVKVAIRMRPMLPSDNELAWVFMNDKTLQENPEVAASFKDDPALKDALRDRQYSFNEVYHPDTHNEEIYQRSVRPIVNQVLAGYHGTIIAYGQTNSGKTHTMFGFDRKVDPVEGIAQAAIRDIFSHIANNPQNVFHVKVSYMEIYNENVRDLLTPDNSKDSGLAIRDASLSGDAFEIVGLSYRIVHDVAGVFEAMKEGNANKSFGKSYLNEQSSRSHTIFRVTVSSGERLDPELVEAHKEAQEKADPTPAGGSSPRRPLPQTAGVTISELNLVDLAGSETLTMQYDEQQRKETKHINLALTNLKSVITMLSENEGYIPYRRSNLTKALRNGLGGNSQTVIICCASPASNNFRMTKSTLHFGTLAKNIRNRVTVNYKEDVEHRDMLLRHYKSKNEEMKRKMAEFEAMRRALQRTQNECSELAGTLSDLRSRDKGRFIPTSMVNQEVHVLSDQDYQNLQTSVQTLQTENELHLQEAEAEANHRQRLELALEAMQSEVKMERARGEKQEAHVNKLQDTIQGMEIKMRALERQFEEHRTECPKKLSNNQKALRRITILYFVEKFRRNMRVRQLQNSLIRIVKNYTDIASVTHHKSTSSARSAHALEKMQDMLEFGKSGSRTKGSRLDLHETHETIDDFVEVLGHTLEERDKEIRALKKAAMYTHDASARDELDELKQQTQAAKVRAGQLALAMTQLLLDRSLFTNMRDIEALPLTARQKKEIHTHFIHTTGYNRSMNKSTSGPHFSPRSGQQPAKRRPSPNVLPDIARAGGNSVSKAAASTVQRQRRRSSLPHLQMPASAVGSQNVFDQDAVKAHYSSAQPSPKAASRTQPRIVVHDRGAGSASANKDSAPRRAAARQLAMGTTPVRNENDNKKDSDLGLPPKRPQSDSNESAASATANKPRPRINVSVKSRGE